MNDDLVSTVDFAPTVLSLAGISIPEHMEGQAFLGSQKSKPRDYIYAARDRMDTEYDRVRIVRDKQFKYVFNYMPEKINYQEIAFRLGIPMMNEILQLRNERKLNDIQMRWFNTKPSEELYDLESDPNELYNLVNVATYKSKLNELRNAFNAWTIQTKDRGGIPEKEMIQDWWNGKNEPPNVSEIRVEKVKNGVTLRCETPGASLAYRILNQELHGAQHEIMTWDFGLLDPKIRNGGKLPAAPVWNLYQGTIHLERGDTLVAQAYRAGYKESSLQFICD